eukprot:6208907-Pleurochrysis_carterae.AAC.1
MYTCREASLAASVRFRPIRPVQPQSVAALPTLPPLPFTFVSLACAYAGTGAHTWTLESTVARTRLSACVSSQCAAGP